MEISGQFEVLPPFNINELNDARQKLDIKKTSPNLVANFKTKETNIYKNTEKSRYPLVNMQFADKQYLQFGKFTTPQDKLVTEIKENMRNINKQIEVVNKTFEFLRKLQDKGSSAKDFNEARLSTVEIVIRKKLTSCGAMTNLAASVLRSLGLPTKCVHGLIYTTNGWFLHAWTEIFFEDIGYIPFDITTKDMKIHAGHIKLITCSDWSELDFNKIINAYKKKSFIYEVR